MYSFEGDFKRKPVQSLGGASKKVERNLLLQIAQEEREKREEQRLRQISAVKIQSYYRSACSRAEKKNEERCKFDTGCHAVQKSASSVNASTLNRFCSQLVFFYEQSKDSDRLTWLCQLLLKQKGVFVASVCGAGNKDSNIFLLNRLLLLCCRHLREVCETSSPIAVPLRMLEVFTALNSYSAVAGDKTAKQYLQSVLYFLVSKGYFGLMRTLMNAKVPSSLEWSAQPPTPLAASILELLMKPLSFISLSTDQKYKSRTLQHLCKEVLCPAYTEQVSQFLLPAMVHNTVCPFPFVEMLHAVIPSLENTVNGAATCSDIAELTIEPTAWLLYAVLNLSAQYLERLNAADIVLYLRLLQKLVPQLNLSKTDDSDDDMSDSDDETDAVAMDTRMSSLSGVVEVREECVRLLDSMEHVKGIVSTVTRNPDTPTLTAVCTVCYTLMSSNKLSVLRMRLLYSLAFNPTLLRNLYHACVSVSTTAVTGVQTPLIHMLSRGLTMSQFDLDRLVPLLAVFCSLFSYSLISLHDSEFYGREMDPIVGTIRPKVASTMPFTLAEIVPLSQMLRDVCLGIIELAHPDTRPTLQEDYKKAFLSVGVKGHVFTAENLQKQRHTWAYMFRTISQLVRQLHARDTRQPFCPANHWLAWRVNIQADKPSQIYRAENPVFVRRPFGALSNLKKKKVPTATLR